MPRLWLEKMLASMVWLEQVLGAYGMDIASFWCLVNLRMGFRSLELFKTCIRRLSYGSSRFQVATVELKPRA